MKSIKTIFSNLYLRMPVSFIFVLFIFYSCNKDDALNSSELNISEKRQGYINFETLTSKIGESNAFKSNLKYFNNTAPLQSKGVEFVNAYVDTTIIYLKESEFSDYFTLRIINNNPQEKPNAFYNLVFEQNKATGEVTSTIVQFLPALEWFFDKSQPFIGTILTYDNQLFSIDDLEGGLNGELPKAINPCIISIEWVCTVNNHPPGTPGCGGRWVITLGPGCSGSGGSGGGGSSSGSTQTVVIEICDGYSHDGGPANSEDCKDDYAAYFTPYICEDYVDFALINYINTWAPQNIGAATDLANYLKSNYPEDDDGNCADIMDFEDPLKNYDFTEESPQILIFEQDYRNRMSQAELTIFNNLSRLQQLDYLHSAYLAQEYAKYYFEDTVKVQYNGKGDAYRHTLWNAIGAAKLGANLMEQLASAHEIPDPGETNDPLEEVMDLYNNQIGRYIGSKSSFFLMYKVKVAVDKGETLYISPTGSNGEVIPGWSQIKPTNQ